VIAITEDDPTKAAAGDQAGPQATASKPADTLKIPALIAAAGEAAVEQYRAFFVQPTWSPDTRRRS
jgi:hypothetical protein